MVGDWDASYWEPKGMEVRVLRKKHLHKGFLCVELPAPWGVVAVGRARVVETWPSLRPWVEEGEEGELLLLGVCLGRHPTGESRMVWILASARGNWSGSWTSACAVANTPLVGHLGARSAQAVHRDSHHVCLQIGRASCRERG